MAQKRGKPIVAAVAVTVPPTDAVDIATAAVDEFADEQLPLVSTAL